MSGDHRHRRLSNHRPTIVAAKPERKPSRAYVLQTASGETIPVLKEALVELTRTAGLEDLGVRRRGYGRVHVEVRSSAGLRCDCGPRTPTATTGSEGSDTIETWRSTKICQALPGRRRSDSSSM